MSRLKNRVGVATGVFLSSAAVSGCGNETLSTKENAIKVAETRYAKEFKAASPVGKFTMQYIASVEAIVPKARDFLGDIDAYWITFNNGCMKNKAYDIAGGIVTDNDEVEGRVLATAADAYVDPEHPDMLIVRSGHTASRDLTFTGLQEGTRLVPANQQTVSVLGTYGCAVGFQGIRTDYDPSESFIVE